MHNPPPRKRYPVAIRIIINLYYILCRKLIYPFYLLKVWGWHIVAAFIAIAVWLQFSEEEEKVIAVSTPPVSEAKRVEDGNSAFATDLVPRMDQESLRYYSNVFYKVMDEQPADESYSWTFRNMAGAFVPSGHFANSAGDKCRRFKEVLRVGSVEQRLEGIACPQPQGGWCKLRKSAAPKCNIGGKGLDFMDKVGRGFKRLF